jgi:hypothetical protein
MSETLECPVLDHTSGRRVWETPVLRIVSLREAAKSYLGGAQKMVVSPPSPPPAIVRVKSEMSTDTASQRLV